MTHTEFTMPEQSKLHALPEDYMDNLARRNQGERLADDIKHRRQLRAEAYQKMQEYSSDLYGCIASFKIHVNVEWMTRVNEKMGLYAKWHGEMVDHEKTLEGLCLAAYQPFRVNSRIIAKWSKVNDINMNAIILQVTADRLGPLYYVRFENDGVDQWIRLDEIIGFEPGEERPVEDIYVDRECLMCGKTFKSPNNAIHFCSDDCYELGQV